MTETEAQGLVDEINAGILCLGEKLLELRNRRGWQALGYVSWDVCVRAEFNYTRQHANRLIKAQEFRARLALGAPDQVEPIGSTHPPDNGKTPESHARVLGRLPDDQQIACYEDFLDECNKAGAKPTARGLRKKVDLWLADNEPYTEPEDDAEDYVQVDDDDQHAADDAGDLHVDADIDGEPDAAPAPADAATVAQRAKCIDAANECINILSRIGKSNPYRARAWEIVRDFLDANDPSKGAAP